MGKLTSTIGIPIKLLNEAQGHVVTLEITSGQVYRGKLLEAEDNMNVQLKDITVTARDGRVSHLDQVYIRGSHVRFFIVPDMLSLTGVAVTNAPQATSSAPASGREKLESEANASSSVTSQSAAAATPTFAGYTTHSPLRIETKYYTADIPIWVDELPFSHLSAPSPSSSSTSTSTAQDQEHQTQTPAASDEQQPNSITWKNEFLSEEAREVRDVIGAVVVVIQKPAAVSAVPGDEAVSRAREQVDKRVRGLKGLLGAVAEVRSQIERERGGVGEVPGLVVLVGGDEGRKEGGRIGGGLDAGVGDADAGLEEIVEFSTRWWEDELSEMGIFELEIVAWDPKGEEETKGKRNLFGELEGMPRIKEVLQTNEWTSTRHTGDDQDGLADFLLDSDEENGFDKEAGELEREMFGLRLAIEKGGDDDGGEAHDLDHGDDEDDELHVEKMDGLMLRMQAIKDMAAELPEAERKAFAVKAINDIMKEM
ncbi:hypothetical protein FQN50_000692 [Emmonsiellopsis sp. PD_5]|nr:hypothetical protein FQN50_000692 [Emmonsiellopsis sp. PD_5]